MNNYIDITWAIKNSNFNSRVLEYNAISCLVTAGCEMPRSDSINDVGTTVIGIKDLIE